MFGRLEIGVHGYLGPSRYAGVSRPDSSPPPLDELNSLEYDIGGAFGLYAFKNVGFWILILGEWEQVKHYYYTSYPDLGETITPNFAINIGFEFRARGGDVPTTVYNFSYTIRRGLHLGIDFDF